MVEFGSLKTRSHMSLHVLSQASFVFHYKIAFDALKIRTMQVQFLVIMQCFSGAEIHTTIIAFAGWRFVPYFMRTSQMTLLTG